MLLCIYVCMYRRSVDIYVTIIIVVCEVIVVFCYSIALLLATQLVRYSLDAVCFLAGFIYA